MTDRLHCPIFHEFDGQCCRDDEPCVCTPPMSVTPHDSGLRLTTIAAACAACLMAWGVIVWLVSGV